MQKDVINIIVSDPVFCEKPFHVKRGMLLDELSAESALLLSNKQPNGQNEGGMSAFRFRNFGEAGLVIVCLASAPSALFMEIIGAFPQTFIRNQATGLALTRDVIEYNTKMIIGKSNTAFAAVKSRDIETCSDLANTRIRRDIEAQFKILFPDTDMPFMSLQIKKCKTIPPNRKGGAFLPMVFVKFLANIDLCGDWASGLRAASGKGRITKNMADGRVS